MRWNSRFQFAIRASALLGGVLLMARAVPRAQLSANLTTQAAPAPLSSPTPQAAKRVLPEFFVMIDPSHGGDDKGAMLAGGKVAEKEISLTLARELKRQLEERGIAARLLRDSDVNLSLERRASTTNEERPGIYVALHAGRPGKGVRVYSPALALAQPPAAGRFLPWEAAQAGSLERSRAVARIVANEMRKTGLPVASLAIPLRPLNNLITPAIAVEWAPGPEDLRPPQAQRLGNMLASAIASGIVQARSQGAARQ
jgi:N-acetylmuramoyl-L-alanine amidase